MDLDENKTGKISGSVNSVAKALRILDCFSVSEPALTLAQICQKMRLPKSTALNLIRTLEQCNYLVRNRNTQTYSLGYKILEHSHNLLASMPVMQYSVPLLESIQIETGMIVYLVTHVYGRALFLEGVYPSRRIPFYSTTGKIHPMHCTSCGKVMLAYMPEEKVRQIVDLWGLEKRTENTISDIDSLFTELDFIRKRGYAIDNEEETPGIKCIAAAIRNSTGFPVGAISLSASVTELKDPIIPEYAKLLLNTCNMLSDKAHQFPGNQEE